MRRQRTYTVIVGRPDYVSDESQLTDTYMTSLKALNAAEAGEFACIECARVDSEDQEEINPPADYVVVAVIRGQHNDLNGRTDL